MSTDSDLTPLIAALAALFPEVKPGPRPPCRNCGDPDVRSCELCGPCYDRWVHADRPEFVPPRQRRRKRKGSRLEEFAKVRRLGATVVQAAKAIGIPEYMGWRYELRINNTPTRRAS